MHCIVHRQHNAAEKNTTVREKTHTVKTYNTITGTVQSRIETTKTQLLLISASRRSTLVRLAREFISRSPSCADHSTFWRGLSARQIIAAGTATA
jgi:hypothetical protein